MQTAKLSTSHRAAPAVCKCLFLTRNVASAEITALGHYVCIWQIPGTHQGQLLTGVSPSSRTHVQTRVLWSTCLCGLAAFPCCAWDAANQVIFQPKHFDFMELTWFLLGVVILAGPFLEGGWLSFPSPLPIYYSAIKMILLWESFPAGDGAKEESVHLLRSLWRSCELLRRAKEAGSRNSESFQSPYFCPKELLTDLYKCAFLASSAWVPGLVLFLCLDVGLRSDSAPMGCLYA